MSRHVLTPVAVAVFSLSVLGPPVQAQDNPLAQELANLRALAEAGATEAQYIFGVMYDTGLGVPQDAAEAVRWFRLAAEQGHASAQNNLGIAYGTGEGRAVGPRGSRPVVPPGRRAGTRQRAEQPRHCVRHR